MYALRAAAAAAAAAAADDDDDDDDVGIDWSLVMRELAPAAVITACCIVMTTVQFCLIGIGTFRAPPLMP